MVGTCTKLYIDVLPHVMFVGDISLCTMCVPGEGHVTCDSEDSSVGIASLYRHKDNVEMASH